MRRQGIQQFFLGLLISVFCCFFPGCGGGSVGTGTGGSGNELRLQGRIETDEGAPVANAEVTVLETGDSDITDGAGNFEIVTEQVADQLTLSVTSNQTTQTTTINADGADGVISITVKFNPLVNEIVADNLQTRAQIVGQCDRYFENSKPIRQANDVPFGVECTAKVKVVSNGIPLAHVPFAIQYRACERGAKFVTSALGQTMTGGNLGIGQAQFNYFDDETHCLWRIVVPFQVEGVDSVIWEIHSFTYQDLH